MQGTQTAPVAQQTASTSTEDAPSVATQTEASAAAAAAAAQPATPALRRFLSVAAPLLEAELSRAAASTALNALLAAAASARVAADDGGGAAGTGGGGVPPPQQLALSARFRQPSPVVGAASLWLRLPCSALAWSSTGSQLACAFGAQACGIGGDEASWCSHRAGLVLWRVAVSQQRQRAQMREAACERTGSISTVVGGVEWEIAGVAAAAVPAAAAAPAAAAGEVYALEWRGCLTALAWQPSSSAALLAVGTAGGEVLLVDAPADAEPVVRARSRSDDLLHREAITGLSWLPQVGDAPSLLLSASTEGRLHLWAPVEAGFAFPLRSFQVAARPRWLAAVGGEAADGDEAAGGGGGGGSSGGGGGDEDGAAVMRAPATAPVQPAVPTGVSAIASLAVGGCVVGTAGGLLVRCAVTPPPAAAVASALAEWRVASGGSATTVTGPSPQWAPPVTAGATAETTLPWEASAAAALARLPAGERARAARSIERYARGASETAVTLRTLYAARAPAACLLLDAAATAPPAAARHAHAVARISALAASPLHAALLASGGEDGRLCLHSVLAAGAGTAPCPRLTLEIGLRRAAAARRTTAATVTAIAWSPTRPCVIAAATADGAAVGGAGVGGDGIGGNGAHGDSGASIAVFDLFASTDVAAADALPHARTSVSALAFHPRRGDLLASGDAQGVVMLHSLPQRLAVEQPGEVRALARWLRG